MWNKALSDAKAQLTHARALVADWEWVIKTCKERIADGTPWPTQTDDQSQKQQHSV
jgi:hypothetical protein